MLLITVDGPSVEQVEREYEAIGELCLQNGAMEVYVADNFTTSERIWKVRRNIAEAFKIISPHQSLEDVVVPIASIANSSGPDNAHDTLYRRRTALPSVSST